MELLLGVIQQLSLARDLDGVRAIVRRAARALTGADGATFVLRDGEHCVYVDEDAIAPLWKGQRFPLTSCVSGWAMLHREAVAIEDVFADPRVPAAAYRPTFVQSLVMVPICSMAPVGAIGVYWAHRHHATAAEIHLLGALADSTSVAMENVHCYQTLEARVAERTRELERSRVELSAKNEALLRAQRQKDAMAELLVHDLRSPANGILLACKARLRQAELSASDRRYWNNVHAGAEVINRMALNLLDVTRSEEGAFVLRKTAVDLPALLAEVHGLMSTLAEGREQRLELEVALTRPMLWADDEMLRRLINNLVDNALRHNAADGTVRIEAREVAGDAVEIRVVDEGPGIPAHQREAIFEKYTRLEQPDDQRLSVGRGLGLTFCRLAVHGHHGTITVQPNEPRGCVFAVVLPRGIGPS